MITTIDSYGFDVINTSKVIAVTNRLEGGYLQLVLGAGQVATVWLSSKPLIGVTPVPYNTGGYNDPNCALVASSETLIALKDVCAIQVVLSDASSSVGVAVVQAHVLEHVCFAGNASGSGVKYAVPAMKSLHAK